MITFPLRDLLSRFFIYGPAFPGISTLSLHDALPILAASQFFSCAAASAALRYFSAWVPAPGILLFVAILGRLPGDRKSTRLNSSHRCISYAVFCLKKKNTALSCYFMSIVTRTQELMH